MLVVCVFCFSFGVVEKDLPRKTVSLVVALVSPTLLEATHSYMASSRGVRKGWILSTEPEPSSNSITCRCERQDNVKGDFLVHNGWGTFCRQKQKKNKKQQCQGHSANNTDGDWHNVLPMTETKAAAYLTLNSCDIVVCEYCGYVLYVYKKKFRTDEVLEA